MITIQLGTIPGSGTVDPWDTATATVDSHAYSVRSRSTAVCKLCRLVRERGTPDQPWRAVTGTGTEAMRGPSIYAMADRTISEGDRSGPRWKRYQAWGT